MAKNIFLSFAMEDKTLVELFRGNAKNKNSSLEFNDHSVKEPFESKWKTNVKEKINRCSTVICLIGDTTYKSDAVEWEIEEAIRQNKRVIAVKLNKHIWAYPPSILKNHIKVLDWNIDSIMNELDD